ncbi:MAG: glutaminyl-peptide cyclotransferase [Atopococcus tabaci]|uniref:Glutaminyl-peptide cyclotransferase n=1 Tax=Atopococcus tabaci TaxID=269774 RepID=A0AA43ZSX8_9LACT|nr:glutaminyl-peptide cyclotransferase [Atopococcus tabaci]
MRNRYRGLPFSKEALTWYRRITGLQLTLGLIAVLFLLWNNNRDKGTYDIINRLEYNSQIDTQAIEWTEDHRLLVSSDLHGRSAVGYLEDSYFDIKYSLNKNEFAEDFTLTPHGLWLLTWKNERAYLLEPDSFQELAIISYEGEGWGLAYDAGRDFLYMSDGTSTIQVRDSHNFDLLDTFEVRTTFGQEITLIKELEYDGSHLYANIYQSNRVIRIEVERFNKGRVTNEWDFTPLIHDLKKVYPNIQELNGIAHLQENQFLVTGKKYPYIYKLYLN